MMPFFLTVKEVVIVSMFQFGFVKKEVIINGKVQLLVMQRV